MSFGINPAYFMLPAGISTLPTAESAYTETRLFVENLLTIDKVAEAYEATQQAFFSDSKKVASSIENLSETLDTSLFAMSTYKTPTLLLGDIPRQKSLSLLDIAKNARDITISSICKQCLQPGDAKILDVVIQQKALACLNSIKHEPHFNRTIRCAIQQLNDPEKSCNINFPELDRMIEAFYRIEDSISEFLYTESKKNR